MNRIQKGLLPSMAAMLMLALAACDGPKATPEVVPLLAPPPPSSPALGRSGAPAASQTLHSSVNEKTSVSADGTVRTTRTTTSVGFNPDRAAAAVDGLLAAAARPSDGSIPGTWTSRSSSTGTGCSVALYGDASATQGTAASACNSSSMLAGADSWRYADSRLTLYKGGQEAMVFHRAGPHRFDGTAKWGFLTTTITLSR